MCTQAHPFSNFTVINQPEVLYDEAHYGWNTAPNGGLWYVQGAKPAGPAVWMINEAVERCVVVRAGPGRLQGTLHVCLTAVYVLGIAKGMIYAVYDTSTPHSTPSC